MPIFLLETTLGCSVLDPVQAGCIEENVVCEACVKPRLNNDRRQDIFFQAWVGRVGLQVHCQYQFLKLSLIFQRKEIGPPEAEFSFPSSVLAFIRFLVPGDVKGELREVCFFPFFNFVS